MLKVGTKKISDTYMKISKKKNCVNFAAVQLKVIMRSSEYTQNERLNMNMNLYKK